MRGPRIRSVKPEIWQDESVGDLGHSARLLLLGLITMADDEGRLRALPTLILGHVFPYDEVSPAKLKRWIGEIEAAGFIVTYQAEGKPYIAFRHWARHQNINRAKPSVLPEPNDPQVVSDNALSQAGASTEPDGRDHGRRTTPRAGVRSAPDPVPSPVGDVGLPEHRVAPVLDHVAHHRELAPPDPAKVEAACKRFPDRDHLGEAERFKRYYTAGKGENARMPDVVERFESWLETSPSAANAAPAPKSGGGARSEVRADLEKLERQHAAAVEAEAAV